MMSKRTSGSSQERSIYTRTLAAQITHISLDFLRRCEEEHLIQIRITGSGEEGFNKTDLRRLVRIHRLCQDLDLDLGAVDVILHLRQQILDLRSQMEALEQQMVQREKELLDEIQRLRQQSTAEADWQA